MRANPVRKVHSIGAWITDIGTGVSRPFRVWVAVCPDCGEQVRWRGGYPGTGRTRKNTKDALHRHRLERHG